MLVFSRNGAGSCRGDDGIIAGSFDGGVFDEVGGVLHGKRLDGGVDGSVLRIRNVVVSGIKNMFFSVSGAGSCSIGRNRDGRR